MLVLKKIYSIHAKKDKKFFTFDFRKIFSATFFQMQLFLLNQCAAAFGQKGSNSREWFMALTVYGNGFLFVLMRPSDTFRLVLWIGARNGTHRNGLAEKAKNTGRLKVEG
jgi:hypothetical protein